MTNSKPADANLSAPATIYLHDYKKPDYQLDSVELTFDLHETRTRVYSRLAFRRAPGIKQPVALKLDASHLQLIMLKLNGEILAPHQYQLEDESLSILTPPGTV